MSNVEELHEMLTKHNAKIHVTWGPKANQLTDEERASIVLDILHQDALDAADSVEVSRSQLKSMYKAMRIIDTLTRVSVSDILNGVTKEVTELKSSVNRQIEESLMFLGNYLKLEEIDEILRSIHNEFK